MLSVDLIRKEIRYKDIVIIHPHTIRLTQIENYSSSVEASAACPDSLRLYYLCKSEALLGSSILRFLSVFCLPLNTFGYTTINIRGV